MKSGAAASRRSPEKRRSRRFLRGRSRRRMRRRARIKGSERATRASAQHVRGLDRSGRIHNAKSGGGGVLAGSAVISAERPQTPAFRKRAVACPPIGRGVFAAGPASARQPDRARPVRSPRLRDGRKQRPPFCPSIGRSPWLACGGRGALARRRRVRSRRPHRRAARLRPDRRRRAGHRDGRDGGGPSPDGPRPPDLRRTIRRGGASGVGPADSRSGAGAESLRFGLANGSIDPGAGRRHMDFRDRARIPARRRAARRPSGKGAAPSRGGFLHVPEPQPAGHQPRQ